ncbi:MAG: DUF4185 domain-containing protein [Spirochaetes bacterium]|nr:DUF4185 domain-containing protein [Spirochaetota bacterium]
MHFRRPLTLLSISILCLLIPYLPSCRQDPCRVENLGIFVHPDSDDIVGLDGCASIPLDKRTVLWTFGDTIIGRFKKKITAMSAFEDSAVMKGMLSNSIALTGMPDNDTIERLRFRFFRVDGAPVEFLLRQRGDRNRNRIWPVDGIRLGDTVYLYYMAIRIEVGSGSPFRTAGTGIAAWKLPPAPAGDYTPDFVPLHMLFGGDEPVFGDSVIRRQGWIIVTGHRSAGGSSYAYIARAPETSITMRKRYQFLTAHGGWTTEIAEAGRFFGDVAGEPTLTFNDEMDCYVVLYCGLGGEIKSITCRALEQLPCRIPRTIYIPPPLPRIEGRSFMFYYSGKEIFSTENHVYAIYINPAIYQPTLIRIPNRALSGNCVSDCRSKAH